MQTRSLAVPRAPAHRLSAGGLVLLVAVVSLVAALGLETCGQQRPGPTPVADVQPLSVGVVLAGMIASRTGAPLPGVHGEDYFMPTAADLDYFQSNGLNLVRFDVQWERVQEAPFGPLRPAEVERVRSFVAAAGQRQMRVVLNLYGYGRWNPLPTIWTGSYGGLPLGSAQLPGSALADVWQKLASELRGTPGLFAYELMNEPHHLPVAWGDIAQATVDAIRAVDREPYVIVPGYDWSNTHFWWENNADLAGVVDPAGRILFAAHAYPDADNDSNSTTCWSYEDEGAYPTVYADRVKPFVDWLRRYGKQGYLGEFAVPAEFGCVRTDARWLNVLENLIQYLRANSDVLPYATYFVAGTNVVGEFSIQPEGPTSSDRPQLAVLREVARDSTVEPSKAPAAPTSLTGVRVQEAYSLDSGLSRAWADAEWKNSLIEARNELTLWQVGFAGGRGSRWELRESTVRGAWGRVAAAGQLGTTEEAGYFTTNIQPIRLAPGYYLFSVYVEKSEYSYGNQAATYPDFVFYKSSSGANNADWWIGSYPIRLAYTPTERRSYRPGADKPRSTTALPK